MMMTRVCALFATIALALAFTLGGVAAQTESATAEDGKPASEAPAANPAPSVPVGANLTPPVGLMPPGPPLIGPAGTGQPGSSSVSMAPGTLTSGVAREGENARRAPAAEPAPAPAPAEPAPPAAGGCGDYPTWYDAQLALESSVDPALSAALDPDGDAIACEELMY